MAFDNRVNCSGDVVVENDEVIDEADEERRGRILRSGMFKFVRATAMK